MSTHVDISDVLQGLHAMQARGMDLRPVFRDVREQLKHDVEEHFEKKEGSDGSWPGLAPSTIERRRQMKGSVRRRGARKGELTKRGARRVGNLLGRFRRPNTYRFFTSRQDLTMKARGGWAGLHQFGGVVGRGAVVPQREFLWASDKLIGAFGSALADHVHGGW